MTWLCATGSNESRSSRAAQEQDNALHVSPATEQALHIVDRMAHQNMHRDIIMDFKVKSPTLLVCF